VTLPSSIGRFRHYYRTHGAQATLQRLKVALQRFGSAKQFVLYSCDLPVFDQPQAIGTLHRKKSAETMTAEESERIISHWNPDAMRKLMAERFAAGAELWLLHWNAAVAAYGWTLKEKTMEPHFFPLKPGDVHLFDFFVFPEFRGRNLNPSLVTQILEEVGREGSKRALIEAAVWNKAQHASLAKTPFRKIGAATRKVIFGISPRISWPSRKK
jgi:GNAT superfamily N-acetyltransferase